MPVHQIALSDELSEFASEQAGQGRSSLDEYVSTLIRRDRQAKTDLKDLLLEGARSGTGRAVNREYWDEKRARFLDRHELESQK